jgi:hypothetical protein
MIGTLAGCLLASVAFGQLPARLGSPSNSAPEPTSPALPSQPVPVSAPSPSPTLGPIRDHLPTRPRLLEDNFRDCDFRDCAAPPGECQDECGDCCPDGVKARFSVRHDFGSGVGYTHGYTYVEGFVPLYQPTPGSLVFGDVRAVNFDDARRWEFNAGAGYRTHVEGPDAVLGVNGFYDGRRTDSQFFHQIGVGGEALFGRWELRGNGYFIVGNDRQMTLDTGPLAVGVAANQLIVQRLQIYDVAMGGLDLEGGVLLPVLPKLAPRLFLGYYHYSAEQMQSINGIRARMEAWLGEICSLHLAVQNDAVFDTTVTGGLALHFGGTRQRRDGGPRSVEERLGQRVVRDVNIVIAQDNVYQQQQFPLTVDLAPIPANVTGATTVPATAAAQQDDPTPPPGYICLHVRPPFPGAPGHPETFPGHKFPPGFHHDAFPGRGRWLCVWWPENKPLPGILR